MGTFDRFTERFRRREEKEKRHRDQLPTEDEPPLPPPVDPIRKEEVEPGRNDPCPCGSGKKYKHCCLKKKRKK
jgi:preprotein translocase subunit SecA